LAFNEVLPSATGLGGVEGCFLGRSLYYRFGLLHTLAALRGNPQRAANFRKRAGTASDGFLDLAVSDCFTETNVHE
tara:strand:+ start:615 stop:842 length:228 start_codon:yes stop_codon:yes gene_type:complete